MCEDLSRVKSSLSTKFGREKDAWGFRKTASIQINGRHMLNIWRLMRGEINLTSYTLESVAFHVLHIRLVFPVEWD